MITVKATPMPSARRKSGSQAMMPKVQRINAMAKYCPYGQKGTANFRAACSLGVICLRMATCARRIISQTNTVAKVASAAIVSKTSG